ncbi:MAG: hypothetical protein P8Y53_21375 [Pseudolabrys sp.]
MTSVKPAALLHCAKMRAAAPARNILAGRRAGAKSYVTLLNELN